jgi:hypothetical protein
VNDIGWKPAMAGFSQETLTISTVCRRLIYHRAILDQRQPVEALAELAGFAMAEKYRVSRLERDLLPAVADGSLNLSGGFLRDQMGSPGKIGLWQLVGPGGA